MLDLTGVGASYGSVPAVDAVSIKVGEGEAVGLLGANGAGKSTTLRAISGLVRLTAGTITFMGTVSSVICRFGGNVASMVARRSRMNVDDRLPVSQPIQSRPSRRLLLHVSRDRRPPLAMTTSAQGRKPTSPHRRKADITNVRLASGNRWPGGQAGL